MKDFLNGPDKEFLLYGKPGVGKSTMVKFCLESFLQSDLEHGSINVAGITLSHQAKNVLGEFIPNVFTFASAYGLRERIDKDTGLRSFEYNPFSEDMVVGKSSIPVFVHDEVSTYTAEMIDIVERYTCNFSKVIYIGDSAQLPPINRDGSDKDSPIFTEKYFPDHCKFELTERVRQAKGNPILDLSDIIREEIFGSQNIKRVIQAMSKPKMVNGVGFQSVPYHKLLDHIGDKDMIDECIIAYKNRTVSHFNNSVRNHFFPNEKELVVNGDVICMTENFYNKKDGVDYILHNSEKFKIKNVGKNIRRIILDKEVYRIECYYGETPDGKTFITPTEKGRVDLDNHLSKIAEKCKKREMKWEHFWNLKGLFCEYDYGYSVTNYRVQGSTYENVYVDVNDILLTRPISDKRKLQAIYTAITRARKCVYFLTQNVK